MAGSAEPDGYGRRRGKTGSDPSEPVVNLAFSGGRQLQWAVYPLDRHDTFTNWGHEQVAGQWFHLAVVNDGGTAPCTSTRRRCW